MHQTHLYIVSSSMFTHSDLLQFIPYTGFSFVKILFRTSGRGRIFQLPVHMWQIKESQRCISQSEALFNRYAWMFWVWCALEVVYISGIYVLGVIRYPGSDSPLEDSVYLASHDFVVDVMGCESATLTLKPCSRDSGNVVEVLLSAGNNISSKIQ